ncbi:LysR family transcriptional regulator [Streptomyces vinaceus]|uniref:LysR family transcriptional regulator n=1 Tax=Streptomyces vinaceus TaxID=1960 RepID=UPI00380A2B4E
MNLRRSHCLRQAIIGLAFTLMDLEVRHLKVVCAVATAGSVHKAARALGVSQPTLAAQLRRIEDFLGGKLFTRHIYGCSPTMLGQQLISRARPIVDEMSSLASEMKAAACSAKPGTLVMGGFPCGVIPGWIARLREFHPTLHPVLQTGVSSRALLRDVSEGQLDVALVVELEEEPIRFPPGVARCLLIDREPVLVQFHERHPAAELATIQLTDVAADQWVANRNADGQWESIHQLLRSAGITPRVHHADYATSNLLVKAGEVVGLCQAMSEPKEGVVVRRRLEGDPRKISWFLVGRTEAFLETVYPALVAEYRSRAEILYAYGKIWDEHWVAKI